MTRPPDVPNYRFPRHSTLAAMVPHDIPPPAPEPRSLSPEAAAALRDAIVGQWQAFTPDDTALAAVVDRVARDARERGLQPEQLIIALKEIERALLGGADGPHRTVTSDARQRLREWLIGAIVRAYFSA